MPTCTATHDDDDVDHETDVFCLTFLKNPIANDEDSFFSHIHLFLTK